MGKIKDTNTYPLVTPTDGDYIVGTDVSQDGKTVNFTFESVASFISADINDSQIYVAQTIDDLAAYDGILNTAIVSEPNRGGSFVFEAGDSLDYDNGTTIASTGRTGRWNRIISDGDDIKLNWWDLDVNDHTSAFQSLAAYCNANYNTNRSDPKGSNDAYIPKYGLAYKLTNPNPIIWFCNVKSDTDARINYLPELINKDNKYGICFQIGVDEMDMDVNINAYASQSISDFLPWRSATAIEPDTLSTKAGRIRISLSSNLYPSGLAAGDFVQVRRSESPYNNASFEIESIDSFSGCIYGYYAKWTGIVGSDPTTTIATTPCVADSSLDIQVRFRRADLEVSAATMNGFTVHLPQIFNGLNTNASDYPLFNNRKNTAVVLKQMRSCNVTFNRIWYFQTAIRVLGSDSIKAIENNLGNVYNLGRFRDNGIHIDASPNMNIGGFGGATPMAVGQIGTSKGGTCNNNTFIGGYINSTNYELFPYPTISTNVESITVSSGVCTLTFVNGFIEDMALVKVGYVVTLKGFLSENNGAFIVKSVNVANRSITYNNSSGVPVASPTSTQVARMYISGISGNHLLRAFSNTSRIVGRPDNNNFIGTIFEDRGAICEHQFYLVGMRKTSFIGCRYETGDNTLPQDKNKPYMKFVAADGNIFQNGTGLEYRKVTSEENSSGNKFMSEKDYDIDISDADSLRVVEKGEMRVSGGSLNIVDSYINIPTLADDDAIKSSLYVSSANEKLVWKDSSGVVNNLY